MVPPERAGAEEHAFEETDGAFRGQFGRLGGDFAEGFEDANS